MCIFSHSPVARMKHSAHSVLDMMSPTCPPAAIIPVIPTVSVSTMCRDQRQPNHQRDQLILGDWSRGYRGRGWGRLAVDNARIAMSVHLVGYQWSTALCNNSSVSDQCHYLSREWVLWGARGHCQVVGDDTVTPRWRSLSLWGSGCRCRRHTPICARTLPRRGAGPAGGPL